MIQIKCWPGLRTGLPASFQIKRADPELHAFVTKEWPVL